VQIGPNGATFAGDPAQNASYFAYGKELLAVLDGRVVSTLDGIPENVPNGPPAVTLEPGNLPGNSIVLQFDEDHFALYAHLIPGTLRVRPGDRVRRGEVLGLLGNSGGSTQPHLHFQVMDRPIPLAADGLPFVFDHFWRRDYRIDCDNPNQNCDPADGPTRLILGRPHYVTDETFMNDDLGDFTER
jgi:murein DD-endopeptidase MepM/ murein hydrolase activator NlpD